MLAIDPEIENYILLNAYEICNHDCYEYDIIYNLFLLLNISMS